MTKPMTLPSQPSHHLRGLNVKKALAIVIATPKLSNSFLARKLIIKGIDIFFSRYTLLLLDSPEFA